MKSIQNQYNQLIEGNISQANFMRNIRMTFPQFITNVTSFDDSVKILKNKGILSEAKKQEFVVNPVELAMGIKVEFEHTKDPKKAEKIAMDHLKENPSYYSELKLSGIDSHQEAPKKKAKKVKKAKEEFVDKENGMKVVKESQEEELEEVGLKLAPNEQPNSAVNQAAQFIDMNNTIKPLSGEISLQNGGNDNEAILQFGYWETLPPGIVEKLSIQFDVEEDIIDDEDTGRKIAYVLVPKPSQFRTGERDLGAAFEKFKSMLEGIVREVLDEENNK